MILNIDLLLYELHIIKSISVWPQAVLVYCQRVQAPCNNHQHPVAHRGRTTDFYHAHFQQDLRQVSYAVWVITRKEHIVFIYLFIFTSSHSREV